MEQATWKRIRRRHRYTVEYIVLMCIIFVFSVMVLYSTYYALKNKDIWPFLFVFASIDFPCIVWMVVLKRLLKNEGAEKRYIPPYTMELDQTTTAVFTQRLKEILEMEPLEAQISTAYKTGKRNILYIMYEMFDVPSKSRLKYLRNKATPKARTRYGLRETMPFADMKKSNRINLFIFEDSDDGMDDLAKSNAFYGMNCPEAVLNVFVGLASRRVLIPAYCSWWNGGSVKYIYCLKKLEKIIGGIRDGSS